MTLRPCLAKTTATTTAQKGGIIMCHTGECECQHGHHQHEPHGRHHDGDHGRCCCRSKGHGFRRRYLTQEERIRLLEDYLRNLEAEAQGVREHIAEQRKAQA